MPWSAKKNGLCLPPTPNYVKKYSRLDYNHLEKRV